MNHYILVKFKSFIFKYPFFGSIILNLIYITWHFLGMLVYYIYSSLKKPYIGGYYCSDQNRFRKVHKMIRLSLEYFLRNNNYKNENLNILEIGTCAGGSTLQICNYLKKKNINNFKIYCLDHWKKFIANRQEKSWNFHEYILNKGLDNGKIFNIFKNNINFSGFQNNVKIIVDSSEESLKKISNIKFDFIYIDGGHSYPVVTSDIKMCIPLLKNQGIICGDDYEIIYDHCDQKKIMEDVLDVKQEFCLENKTQKPYHPGVTLAVKDFFGSIPSHNGFWAQMKINDKFTNIDI